MKIRVVELGATKIRRADVSNNQGKIEINDFIEDETSSFTNLPFDLISFFENDLDIEVDNFVCLVAGPVENNCIVIKMPNLPRFPENFNLKNFLENHLKKDCLIINDMEAAVLGMSYLLKNKSITESFWGITWSTGIGGAFWDGYKVITSEIGHIPLDIFNRATPESLLGGRSMKEEIGRNLDEVTNAYNKGESWAKNFYLKKAELMGKFINYLVTQKNTKLICFKGSIALKLLEKEEIKENIIKSLGQEINIILSPNSRDDALIGAILLSTK